VALDVAWQRMVMRRFFMTTARCWTVMECAGPQQGLRNDAMNTCGSE